MAEYNKYGDTPVLRLITYLFVALTGIIQIILGLMEHNPAFASIGVLVFLIGGGLFALVYKTGKPLKNSLEFE